MELPSIPKKKSRLTLYIIIALVIGIAVGFALNKNYLVEENANLVTLEKRLAEIKIAQQETKDSVIVNLLESKRKELSLEKTKVLHARDAKVEPFSMLADIF